MKALLKKITLYIIIISSASVQYSNASWYNPTTFLYDTTKKIGNAAAVLWSKTPTINDSLAALRANGLFEEAASIKCVDSAEQFEAIINNYLRAVTPTFVRNSLWFNSNELNTKLSKQFMPFVQKAAIQSGSIIVFHGDFHGNYTALQSYLKSLAEQKYLDACSLKILNEQFYMVFLGDYADRGPNGVDVYSTLMQLKMKNPDNVFVLRGNHEDEHIQARYGFIKELQTRFGDEPLNRLKEKLARVYNSFPDALYLRIGKPGNNEYIMCCHGMWELGYDPAPFLKSDSSNHYQAFDVLQRKTIMEKIDNTELKYNIIASKFPLENIENPQLGQVGFLWNDVQASPIASSENDKYRGFIWGQSDVAALAAPYNIKALYRAHQHGDNQLWNTQALKKGYAKSGIVYTFLAAPNKGYPNSFDAWGQLQVCDSYATSKLTIQENKQNVGAVE